MCPKSDEEICLDFEESGNVVLMKALIQSYGVNTMIRYQPIETINI